MFTAFIKILPVGELPSHSHTASMDTTGAHNHNVDMWHGATAAYGPSVNGGNTKWGTKSTSSNGNHTHTVTINYTGSNQPHNNIQPYIAVYIWKRVN